MFKRKGRWMRGLAGAALFFAAIAPGHGQTFPSQPINMVVPYAAGGSSDFVARLLAQKLGEKFGQPVVVENRAGAGATIGTGLAARKGQNGYVALLADNAQTTAPALYKNLPYDSVDDFSVVGFVGKASVMLFANSNAGIKNVQDLIDRARKQPGTITIGTGHGSPSHLITEYFQLKSDIKLSVVPYKGAALALNDLLAGHIDLVFTNPASAAPHLKGGRIVPLAQTGDKRDERFPDLPTFRESGVQGFDVSYWFALLIPADTPADAKEKWRQALSAVLADPEVKEKFTAAGLSPYELDSEQARQTMREEVRRWEEVVKVAKLQTN
ncbi:Bug family tripartite tricarboxylate transporter substrate binding protein [Parapusillimonas sp. JC17]|uniref:Bug family tripartite tricarboxylate transporter substrate binding protein n=1 Tax=Parapusillimonas sp. JC17 TaxID=3445768 RepID=UPI003FA07903